MWTKPGKPRRADVADVRFRIRGDELQAAIPVADDARDPDACTLSLADTLSDEDHAALQILLEKLAEAALAKCGFSELPP